MLGSQTVYGFEEVFEGGRFPWRILTLAAVFTLFFYLPRSEQFCWCLLVAEEANRGLDPSRRYIYEVDFEKTAIRGIPGRPAALKQLLVTCHMGSQELFRSINTHRSRNQVALRQITAKLGK